MKPLLTTWLASAISEAQFRQRRVFGCALCKPWGPSSSLSLSAFSLCPSPPLYSGILESAARSTDFAFVGEEGRMKCAEGGEDEGVVAGEEVAELEREGGK